MTKIILVSVDKSLGDAWENHCRDLDCVEFFRGSILDVKCDAVVSPANSYGFMDGGLDLEYSNHFGWGIQKRLQEIIKSQFYGQLLIGQAVIVETEDEDIPFLISAPTMRVPMPMYNTLSPYLATRGVLLLIKHGIFTSGSYKGAPVSTHLKRIAFPGLATGVGEIEPEICAKQVRFAIREVLYVDNEFPSSWLSAAKTHNNLLSKQ